MDDNNEFDIVELKKAKKKNAPKVYNAKIIMKSKNSIGVLFKGYGLKINTSRNFAGDYIDVYYVNDIGENNFECWIQ
jgi:hypothetical protein